MIIERFVCEQLSDQSGNSIPFMLMTWKWFNQWKTIQYNWNRLWLFKTILKSDAMFLSELNDEMPILNGYNFYRPVIQIHLRKMIDIDKHLFDTSSLTVKWSVILVDLKFYSLKIRKVRIWKKIVIMVSSVKNYPNIRFFEFFRPRNCRKIRGKT